MVRGTSEKWVIIIIIIPRHLLVKFKNLELLKKESQKFFIRKSKDNNKLLDYKALFIVDSENMVQGVVGSNSLSYVSEATYSYFIDHAEVCGLTRKKMSKLIDSLKEGHHLYVYSLYDITWFLEPMDCLIKPVRGMRLVTDDEVKELEFNIVKAWCNNEKLDLIHPTRFYDKIMRDCDDFGIINAFYDYCLTPKGFDVEINYGE